MQVKGTESRILRSSDRTRGNKDERREDKKYIVKFTNGRLSFSLFYFLFLFYF